MADTLLLGLFDNIESTAEAIDGIRQLGVDDKQVTVLSNVPYASKILGRRHPRHLFSPFMVAGVLGGILLGLFVVWITPKLYPIEVGGQGRTPLPPSAMIMFELVALSTMAVSFIGFLLQNRFPILRRQMYDSRITDGYIGVQVYAGEKLADRVAEVFKANHAQDVKRDDAKNYPTQRYLHLFFWGGVGTAGLVVLLIPLLLAYDIVHIPWLNIMDNSPAVQAQEGPRRSAPEAAIPIQGPRLIAGQPATEPLPASPESLERGRTLYGINCSICHGANAGGAEDAAGMVGRYFPEAPALTGDRVQSMSQDDIFLVITNGKNRMPTMAEHLTAGETWDIINYIRSLAPASGSSGQ